MERIPLTYRGEQIGDALVEIDDQGVVVKGTIYDSEKAVEILGPSIEHVSIGFLPDSFDFHGVAPRNVGVKYVKKENDGTR